MHTGGGDRTKISHFRNFWTSPTLTLDWVTQHTIVYHSSISTSYQIGKFHSNRKNFVDGRTDIETDFIRWIQRSRPDKLM